MRSVMGGAELRYGRTERWCAGVADAAGLAGGWTRRVGDDVAAMFEAQGEHAVVSGEIGVGA